MTQMDKEYIEKEYEQAIKEYNAALTEDDLDTARRTMKRLEAIAMQDYGFDYADELAMKKEDNGLISLEKLFGEDTQVARFFPLALLPVFLIYLFGYLHLLRTVLLN